MKSRLQTHILSQQLQQKSGVGYLIPKKWWKQFCHANENVKNKDELIVPYLNLIKYVDNFLIEFQEGIADELQHKSNYLKLNKVVISPQINRNYQWKVISSQVWTIVNAKIQSRFGVWAVLQKDKNLNQISLQQNQIQIQIIFCSKAKSEAFVGFLPQNSNTATVIRNIGFQMGFIEMSNSRISYPDKNLEKPYYFFQLQSVPLVLGQDTFFLVYNLECIEEKQEKQGFSFGINQQLGNSNQAVAGDMAFIGIEELQQGRNNRTMSTGAETPSFVFEDDENHGQFRVRELFRQKQPQQIKELRNKANKIMNGQLIKITDKTEEQLKIQLEHIAKKDLQEHINWHKKKANKEKQLYYQ